MKLLMSERGRGVSPFCSPVKVNNIGSQGLGEAILVHIFYSNKMVNLQFISSPTGSQGPACNIISTSLHPHIYIITVLY